MSGLDNDGGIKVLLAVALDQADNERRTDGTQPFEDGLKRCGVESNSVAPKMGGLHEIALEEAFRKEKEVCTALVRLPCERFNAGDRPFDIAKNLRCLTTPYVQHIDSIRNCVKSTCRLADLSLLTDLAVTMTAGSARPTSSAGRRGSGRRSSEQKLVDIRRDTALHESAGHDYVTKGSKNSRTRANRVGLNSLARFWRTGADAHNAAFELHVRSRKSFRFLG